MNDVTDDDIPDKTEWYSKSKDYWENKELSVNGVLGGNQEIHPIDVKTSCELLEGLIKTNKLFPGRVIDCGAGIGRITSSVLINYFEECDLVEQDCKFVNHCKTIFKNLSKVKNIYLSSLQNFNFEKKYNAIWIQWCLENLDDDDLLNFMINCKKSLLDDGIVIVKENIVNKGTQFINYDYSKVRSDLIFKNIFTNAGFKIVRHFHHPNWPKGFMKVSIFVMK